MAKKQITNYQLLVNLKSELSSNFKERIPEITQTNMENIAETIQSYPTIANEFVQVLTNQVIRTMFMTRTIDNPLSMFEKGDLSKFGKSLELVYVDVIKGKDFSERFGTTNSYENEYLSPEKVENVKVQYLTENSRLKYKVTISNDMLASAFKSEYGLSNLTNQLVSKMVESYNLDKFLMTWRLIDTMKAVDMPGATGSASGSKNDATMLLKQIKKTIKDMRFPSTKFNSSGVWTKSNPEDLFIIMDTATTSEIDVEVLSGVFNLSKVEMASRIIEIPYFADANTQAIICDRDKIQIYQTKYASDTVKNGAGLFTNVFLHRWDLLGACDFANCVRLQQGGVEHDGSLPTRSMPYDNLPLNRKDEDGTVISDLVETELEIENGEIKTKKEKKLTK